MFVSIFKSLKYVLIASLISVNAIPSETDLRLQHTPCKILFSELLLQGKSNDFIEVGKFCPSHGRKNKLQSLDGYYLLILCGTTEIKVVGAYNFNFKTFGNEFESPGVHRGTNRPRKNNPRVPHSTATTVPEFLQPPKGRSLHESVPKDRTFQSANVPRDRIPRSLNNIQNLKRHELNAGNNSSIKLLRKRSPSVSNIYKHIFAYVENILPFSFSKQDTIIFCLLHFKQSGKRNKIGNHFSKDEQLGEEKLSQLQSKIKDVFVIGANPNSELRQQLSLIHPSLATQQSITTFNLEENTAFSINKCDALSSMFDTNKFQYGNPTPTLPNSCEPQPEEHQGDYPYSFQGQSIRTHGQKIVVNIIWALNNVKLDEQFLKKSKIQIVATLVNLNEDVIKRFQRNHDEGNIVTPAKKRKMVKPVIDSIDNDKRRLIYDIISSYYKINQIPKFNQILDKFVATVRKNQLSDTTNIPEELYHCGPDSFRVILKNLGYKYGKIQTRDAVLFDPRIVSLRGKYLKIIRENDALPAGSKLPVLFTDETWFDSHARNSKGWVPKCPKSVQEKKDFTFSTNKVSRGSRIIILHIGGENGFLEGMAEVYPVTSASLSADYHENIHGQRYYEWFQKLMSKLESQGKHLIVMDNVPYHSVSTAPRLNSRKEVLFNWLKEQQLAGKTLPDLKNLRRFELESLVKKLKSEEPQYRVNKLAREHGHQIVRLPPYNCDLNPIELVWADVKRLLRDKNSEQTAVASSIRAKSILLDYNADQWKSHIKHVKKLEETYWNGDLEYENALGSNPELEALALEQADDDMEYIAELEEDDEALVVAGPSRKRSKII